MAASDTMIDLNQKALRLLREDADKIEKLIAIQMENLNNPQMPAVRGSAGHPNVRLL